MYFYAPFLVEKAVAKSPGPRSVKKEPENPEFDRVSGDTILTDPSMMV